MKITTLSAALFLALGTTNAYAKTDTLTYQQYLNKTYNYDISSGQLNDGLKQFLATSPLAISVTSAQIKSLKGRSVKGMMTPQQALTQLIAGSGLTVVKQADNSLLISSISNEVAQLPDVKVTAVEHIEIHGQAIERSSAPTGLDLTAKETPQSISIISLEMIRDFNLQDLEDVMEQATGIYRDKSNAWDMNRYYSRGFESNGFVKDGLPASISYSQEDRLDSAVYESVEVVRGAVGMMAGAGEPSATLNLVTKKPTRDKQIQVSGEVGSWNRYRTELDASGALVESGAVAARTVLVYEDTNTHVDFEDNNKVVAYAQLHAYLGQREDSEVSLTGHYQKSELKQTNSGSPLFFSDGSPIEVSRSTNFASPQAYNDFSYQSVQAKLTHHLNLDWQVTLAAQFSDTEQDILSTFTFLEPDKTTGIGIFGYDSLSTNKVEGTSYTANLLGRFEWLGQEHQINFTYVNTDYEQQSVRLDEYEKEGQDVFFAEYPYDSVYSSRPANIPPASKFSVFGDSGDTVKDQSFTLSGKVGLTDTTHSVVGLKYYDYEQIQTYQNVYGENTHVDHGETGTSVYLGLVHKFTEQLSGYASYTDVYQPQIDKLDSNLEPLEAVTGKNVEAGIKASFLDEQLNLSFAVFDILKQNVAELLPEKPGEVLPRYRQVDGANSQGFEFEVDGQLTQNWSINLGYSQFELENKDGVDINLNAPRKLLNLHTQYQWEKLHLGLGAVWNTSSKTNIFGAWGVDHGLPEGTMAGTLLDEKSGKTVLSMHARYEVTNNLIVQFNVTNLLDKEYLDIYAYAVKSYGQPRAYSLSARYSF